MRDPTRQLHNAYYDLLQGSVVVNHTTIPVYKWYKPIDDTAIFIGLTTMNDQSTHDTYIMEVQQEIYIQYKLRMDDERDTAEDISDEVVQLVIADVLMTMSDFDMIHVELSSVESFEDESTDNTLYKKELIFKHLIAEQNG